MSALAVATGIGEPAPADGSFAPSPAGPADHQPLTAAAPGPDRAPLLQGIHFATRPMDFAIAGHRRFGDVWTMRIPIHPAGFTISCHPDHLASLLKAKPSDAPSLTGESPLRPLLGPNSVLTAVGDRHMRQRKLLLPPFHGEAVQGYVEMIRDVADAEIDRWPVGSAFALAPRMQAVTLKVIMRGVFGLEAEPGSGSTEDRLRISIRRLLGFSSTGLYRMLELRNAGRAEPLQPMRSMLARLDRQIFEVIARRRAAPDCSERDDVLSLLLGARDEQGDPLTDKELRDELMALLLAGHETTANSLAWGFERLLRTPATYDRLREQVRDGVGAAYVEATIHETMRNRPVIPMIVRAVKRRWRFGDYVIDAGSPVAISIIGLHHRDDVYTQPQRFEPERFLDRKPGTYTWIPFGGGIRRCLGADAGDGRAAGRDRWRSRAGPICEPSIRGRRRHGCAT